MRVTRVETISWARASSYFHRGRTSISLTTSDPVGRQRGRRPGRPGRAPGPGRAGRARRRSVIASHGPRRQLAARRLGELHRQAGGLGGPAGRHQLGRVDVDANDLPAPATGPPGRAGTARGRSPRPAPGRSRGTCASTAGKGHDRHRTATWNRSPRPRAAYAPRARRAASSGLAATPSPRAAVTPPRGRRRCPAGTPATTPAAGPPGRPAPPARGPTRSPSGSGVRSGSPRLAGVGRQLGAVTRGAGQALERRPQPIPSSVPASSSPDPAAGNRKPRSRAVRSSRLASRRTVIPVGPRLDDRTMRRALTPATIATSITTAPIAGHRWRCWWVSTCPIVRPVCWRHASWAVNSRRRSSGSTRPAATRGRSMAPGRGQPALVVDERGHLPGAEQRRILPDRGQMGADADAAACPAAPRPTARSPGRWPAPTCWSRCPRGGPAGCRATRPGSARSRRR